MTRGGGVVRLTSKAVKLELSESAFVMEGRGSGHGEGGLPRSHDG